MDLKELRGQIDEIDDQLVELFAKRMDVAAAIGDYKVIKITDYTKPEETGLPAANVLIYGLEGGATVVVRPSGTEPKIKTYLSAVGKTEAESVAIIDRLAAAANVMMKG